MFVQAYTGTPRTSLAFKLQLPPERFLDASLVQVSPMRVSDVYAQLDISIHKRKQSADLLTSVGFKRSVISDAVGYKRPRPHNENDRWAHLHVPVSDGPSCAMLSNTTIGPATLKGKPGEALWDLKIVNHAEGVVLFRVAPSVQFMRVLEVYCEAVGAGLGDYKFVFDGDARGWECR